LTLYACVYAFVTFDVWLLLCLLVTDFDFPHVAVTRYRGLPLLFALLLRSRCRTVVAFAFRLLPRLVAVPVFVPIRLLLLPLPPALPFSARLRYVHVTFGTLRYLPFTLVITLLPPRLYCCGFTVTFVALLLVSLRFLPATVAYHWTRRVVTRLLPRVTVCCYAFTRLFTPTVTFTFVALRSRTVPFAIIPLVTR